MLGTLVATAWWHGWFENTPLKEYTLHKCSSFSMEPHSIHTYSTVAGVLYTNSHKWHTTVQFSWECHCQDCAASNHLGSSQLYHFNIPNEATSLISMEHTPPPPACSACHNLAILCSNRTSQGPTLHATPPTGARTHVRSAETADSNADCTNCLHVL